MDTPNGKVTQLGIVSWGKKCGDPKKAGVYTDVSSK